MEQKQELYYATFAFYDEKGRRLSIFAENITGTDLEISIITCSESDNFSKKFSRALYQDWIANDKKMKGLNPQQFTFKVADKTKPKKEFIQWCRDNFYSMVYMPFNLVGEGTGLVKGAELNYKHFIGNIIKTLKNPVKGEKGDAEEAFGDAV